MGLNTRRWMIIPFMIIGIVLIVLSLIGIGKGSIIFFWCFIINIILLILNSTIIFNYDYFKKNKQKI